MTVNPDITTLPKPPSTPVSKTAKIAGGVSLAAASAVVVAFLYLKKNSPVEAVVESVTDQA